MQQMKGAFFVVTNKGTWGRALNLVDAFKNARAKMDDVKVAHQVTVILFNRGTTEDDMTKAMNLYSVSDFASVTLASDCTKEEKEWVSGVVSGFLQFDNEKDFTAHREKMKNKLARS